VIAGAFSHLWTKCVILIPYRTEEKMTVEAVYQTCGCPFHSSNKVLSPAIDLIPGPTLLLYDV